MKRWVVDTGPLVAYLDAADPAHAAVVARLDDFAGRLLTSSSVVTEAMHFVGTAPDGPRLLAEFLGASGTEVFDFTDPPGLRAAVALMERFSNVPADFADATLLLLAEHTATYDVLTLDRRGFSTYRTRNGKALRLVLDR